MIFQLPKPEVAFARFVLYILQAPINPLKPSLGIALSRDSYIEAIMAFPWAAFVST